MKISSKLMVALLAASMAFSAIGCQGTPPEPPKAMGQADTANGAEISIASFEIATPDFINVTGEASKLAQDQGDIAVLRVKIKNTTDAPITYASKHFHANNRLQLCTDPHPVTGERVNFRAIRFDETKSIHTPNQHIRHIDIPAGGEIIDEYLFEAPVVNNGEKVIVLIPGDIVGATKTMRFEVGQPTMASVKKYNVNEPAVIEGMKVTVKKVSKEHAELLPKTQPKEPLKYAYAYTDKPVMALYLEIENTGSEPRTYTPSHHLAKSGISLYAATLPLKRVQIKDEHFGKGQSLNKVVLKPGEKIKDVYYYETPSTDAPLDFEISGHIFGVRGVYRYSLDYRNKELPPPNLEPYKTPAEVEGEMAAEGEMPADGTAPVDGEVPADGAAPAEGEAAAEAPAEGEAAAEAPAAEAPAAEAPAAEAPAAEAPAAEAPAEAPAAE